MEETLVNLSSQMEFDRRGMKQYVDERLQAMDDKLDFLIQVLKGKEPAVGEGSTVGDLEIRKSPAEESASADLGGERKRRGESAEGRVVETNQWGMAVGQSGGF